MPEGLELILGGLVQLHLAVELSISVGILFVGPEDRVVRLYCLALLRIIGRDRQYLTTSRSKGLKEAFLKEPCIGAIGHSGVVKSDALLVYPRGPNLHVLFA